MFDFEKNVRQFEEAITKEMVKIKDTHTEFFKKGAVSFEIFPIEIFVKAISRVLAKRVNF